MRNTSQAEIVSEQKIKIHFYVYLFSFLVLVFQCIFLFLSNLKLPYNWIHPVLAILVVVCLVTRALSLLNLHTLLTLLSGGEMVTQGEMEKKRASHIAIAVILSSLMSLLTVFAFYFGSPADKYQAADMFIRVLGAISALNILCDALLLIFAKFKNC